jgi:hypothetical protein
VLRFKLLNIKSIYIINLITTKNKGNYMINPTSGSQDATIAHLQNQLAGVRGALAAKIVSLQPMDRIEDLEERPTPSPISVNSAPSQEAQASPKAERSWSVGSTVCSFLSATMSSIASYVHATFIFIGSLFSSLFRSNTQEPALERHEAQTFLGRNRLDSDDDDYDYAAPKIAAPQQPSKAPQAFAPLKKGLENRGKKITKIQEKTGQLAKAAEARYEASKAELETTRAQAEKDLAAQYKVCSRFGLGWVHKIVTKF